MDCAESSDLTTITFHVRAALPHSPKDVLQTAAHLNWVKGHVPVHRLTRFLEPRACLLVGRKDDKTNLISQKLNGLLYIIIKMFYKLLQFFISGLSGYFRFYPLTPDVCQNRVVPRTANWLL